MKDTTETCPVAWTLDIIGGKWKCVILWHVRGRVRRFSELRRLIPGATQKMITAQLRQLERDGLIERKVYAQVPPKVEYSISAYGRSLSPLLESMCKWGVAHRDRNNAGRNAARTLALGAGSNVPGAIGSHPSIGKRSGVNPRNQL